MKKMILGGCIGALAVILVLIVFSALTGGFHNETNLPGNISAGNEWSDDKDTEVAQEKDSLEVLKERIAEYESNGEYENIIQLIKTNVADINSNSEIKALYDSAATNYREKILAEAEEVFVIQGYEAALSTINEGISILSEDELLQMEKNRYLAYVPVDLTTLTPYYRGAVSIGIWYNVVDTMGNAYNTAFHSNLATESEARSIDEDYCAIVWDIGGEYNVLTATGFIEKSDRGGSGGGSYKIYGDGILLYEKSSITSDTKPYSIEVDITGVTDLKIEMFGSGTYGVVSALGNVMLQKK